LEVAVENVTNATVHNELLHQSIAVVAETQSGFLVVLRVKDNLHFVVFTLGLDSHLLHLEAQLLDDFGNRQGCRVQRHVHVGSANLHVLVHTFAMSLQRSQAHSLTLLLKEEAGHNPGQACLCLVLVFFVELLRQAQRCFINVVRGNLRNADVLKILLHVYHSSKVNKGTAQLTFLLAAQHAK